MEDSSIIKIKCPHCGVSLKINGQIPGLEQKSITCPVCKEKSPFTAYKRVREEAEPGTQYGGSERTQYGGETPTELNVSKNTRLGRLSTLMASAESYPLQKGRNVVGRKAEGSTATIQVVSSNRLSREHLVIEVKEVPAKGLVHYASLYKERCNATFVNDVRLEFGDCVILRHGDLLRLPDTVLRFDIHDEPHTT